MPFILTKPPVECILLNCSSILVFLELTLDIYTNFDVIELAKYFKALFYKDTGSKFLVNLLS